jgi:hypothetical protein
MQDSKKFTCLQNENDNAQWRKNSSYSGSDYENNNPQQIPSYVKDDSKDKYWELNLLNLWNRALFNPVPDGNKYQPYFRPFSKGTSSETIVTINYLVTFSPKPWVNEAPPIAFYVYADLRCWGISD